MCADYQLVGSRDMSLTVSEMLLYTECDRSDFNGQLGHYTNVDGYRRQHYDLLPTGPQSHYVHYVTSTRNYFLSRHILRGKHDD